MDLKYSLLILVALAAQNAVAADKNPDAKGISGSFELGLQTTSGNSNTTNVNGAIQVNQNLTHWRNLYSFETIYADSNHEKTSEIHRGSIQSNYKYNDNEFWFVRGAAEQDAFSGYKYKSSVSTGYGNRIWDDAKGSFLVASAGLGYKQNQIETGTQETAFDRGAIGNFSLHLNKELSEHATFRESFNTQLDLEHLETVTESTTSLQASVINNLALKLSYRIQYASKVPNDTAQTTTETSITLLYTF